VGEKRGELQKIIGSETMPGKSKRDIIMVSFVPHPSMPSIFGVRTMPDRRTFLGTAIMSLFPTVISGVGTAAEPERSG
jgi:hypothetical protein